jgi:hypothetical protein
MTLSMRRLIVSCWAICAISGASLAQDSYPNRAIHLIVGLAPGGLADQTARLLAPGLSKELGQSVVVENRAGANGALAARQVAEASPDGYTLMIVLDATLVIGPALGSTVNFDPVKDFTPIARVIDTPMAVGANPKVEARNLAELLALSKKPGAKEIFYGSAGTGSSGHLVGEYIKQLTGLKMTHVPFKGAGPAITDALGGHIDLVISSVSTELPFAEAGTLRLLAVTGDKKMTQLPDAPTAQESDLPELKGFNVQAWAGLVGPPNLPPTIVAKLHKAVSDSLADPDLVSRFGVVSATVATGSPQDFGRQIATEAAQWQKVVDKANLKIE